MRLILAVLICGPLCISLYSQDKVIDGIRNNFNTIEKQIAQKKLIEIKVDSNANDFQCEGVQYKISFWKNLYIKQAPLKISMFTSDAQIAYKTDYYYSEKGICFFIFQEKNEISKNVIEQYRIYVKDSSIIQVVYTYNPDSADKKTKTFTSDMPGEMKNIVQDLMRLSKSMIQYTDKVENVPR
jgi:hypothetical protein